MIAAMLAAKKKNAGGKQQEQTRVNFNMALQVVLLALSLVEGIFAIPFFFKDRGHKPLVGCNTQPLM